MKNLFLVINKEKVYAYIVSIMTVVVIFFVSSIMNSDLKETELTSSNSVENSNIEELNTIDEAVFTSTPYDGNSSDDSNTNNENTVSIESEVETNE